MWNLKKKYNRLMNITKEKREIDSDIENTLVVINVCRQHRSRARGGTDCYWM